MKKPENKNKNSNQKSILKEYSVDHVKMDSTDRVRFALTVNGVTVYGCNVVEGKNGDFISFPSYKGKDGKYYNHVYIPLTDKEQEGILLDVEKELNK